MSLIKCENITMGYEGKTVISNLNLAVNLGDYLCIVGENGSGKTTLMKGLLGLISPLKGQIIYNENLKKNHIGYLPQQNKIQKDFPASVYEVVLSGCLSSRKSPFYSKSDKKSALNNMEKVGITQLKNKCFRELSGGQQQRTLLARALCATEKLLILDEPITGLDPLAANELYSLVKMLNSNGITVIMVTHDVTSALNNASHILHLGKDNYYYGTTHTYIHSDIGSKFLIRNCPCDDCKSENDKSLKGGVSDVWFYCRNVFL